MKLYHGTSASVADIAKVNGLLPRGMFGGESRWKEYPSRQDCVYLTSLLGGYFALATDDPTIIEIDTTFLDTGSFWPDEDFVEQVSRKKKARKKMICRTSGIKENLEQYAGAWVIDGQQMKGWEASLYGLGTCAYRGVVPPEAITKIVYLRNKFHPIIAILRRGIPVVGNVQTKKRRLELATRWLFGEFNSRDWLGCDVLSYRSRDGFPMWQRTAILQAA